jgi:hypothetical protein
MVMNYAFMVEGCIKDPSAGSLLSRYVGEVPTATGSALVIECDERYALGL